MYKGGYIYKCIDKSLPLPVTFFEEMVGGVKNKMQASPQWCGRSPEWIDPKLDAGGVDQKHRVWLLITMAAGDKLSSTPT